jgi:tetratricopeptide (TPR) repeat protein
MSQWESLKDRAAGKWQMPLLLVSLILLAGSLLRLRSASTQLPLNQAAEYLTELVSGAQFESAIDIGDVLLLREGLAGPERAPIHLQTARARYGWANRKRARTADVGRQIVDHYEQAASHGQPLTGRDFESMGYALEWQGKFAGAVEQFEAALPQGVDSPLDLRGHVLALKLDKLDTPPEQSAGLLDSFLGDVGDDRLDLALWAIEKSLECYEDLGKLNEASTLLTRHRDRFSQSDLGDRFGYLEGYLLHATGHHDEAETLLRTIRNRVDRDDETHAMTGWLLGRVVMSDGGPQRPQEAMSFFRDVVEHHRSGPYVAASRLGLAEALAMLERHSEAIEAYRVVVEDVALLGDQRLINRDALRTSLAVTAETQRLANRLREAAEYGRLAATLVDRNNVEQATLYLQQLAQLLSLWAAELDGQLISEARTPPDGLKQASGEEARAVFAEAGATNLELAQLNALNEEIAAASSWQAAELYAAAGEGERAAALYRAFAVERPTNPLIPRALLRIGQLRQASGDLPAAVEAYQECYRRFPRTLDGSRALVPLAQCYLAMGSDYDDAAEKTLRVVLEDSEVFTPQASEFAEALFLLGDAANRRGEFERAIGILEEAITRYPDDPRCWRARFLLADSFRRSALALRAESAEAKFAGEIEQMRSESAVRFQVARQLYRELITEYETRDPQTLSRVDTVYLRHAYLYEADCYFETQDYRRALKLYEEAAGTYRETPSALAAYVQIINSHVFLGRPDEARAALARALVLVNGMPGGAFDKSASPETRQDWKRYFEWLGQSELF